MLASQTSILRHESEQRFIDAFRESPEPGTLAEYRSWLLARGEDLTAIDRTIELYQALEPGPAPEPDTALEPDPAPEPDRDGPKCDGRQLRLF